MLQNKFRIRDLSQTSRTEPTLKGSNVDELDGNEIDRLTDINYTPNRVVDDF